MKPGLLSDNPLSSMRMGLGLAALGRPGYINLGHAEDLQHSYDVEAMEARTHAVLDAAWQLGLRYFDAARSYGRAEEFLGSWLRSRRIAPAAVLVASKWGYVYTADWRVEADHHEIKEHQLPVLRRQAEESRALLGDHLKIYQIHSATLDSGVLENVEVLAELARLKDRGWHMGLSLSGPRQADTLQRALQVRQGGQRLFETVQATWNLLERSAESALKQAHEEGLVVIIKEALANGQLTSRNERPEFASSRRVLEDEASRRHTTVDALALAAVRARPWVDVVLSGAATVEHLTANVQACSLTWDEEIEDRLRPLQEQPEAYWHRRGGLRWN